MDREKTIFDYGGMALMQFGFTILVLSIFCVIVGESAREYSSMFRLGADGLPAEAIFQVLLLSVLTTLLRFVLFSDWSFKRMSSVVRTGLMFAGTVLVVGAFIVGFGWFPTDNLLAWISFLICFAVSTAGTMLVLAWKEKIANQKMERALRKIQGEQDYE